MGILNEIFKYNDKAVEKDPLLGRKRRGRPSENYLLLSTDLIYRIQLLAKTDPTNTAAIEYLASIFLFGKQISLFIEHIDKYYNTEESLLNLPDKFQEAIIVFYENNPDAWERYKINPLIVNKYRNYKRMLLENRNSPGLAEILYRNFGNTYWNYYLFYK